MVDPLSMGVGFAIAAGFAQAWSMGRQGAIRECRRAWRHRGNLDLIYFEDAERDPTISRPKPASADIAVFRESER